MAPQLKQSRHSTTAEDGEEASTEEGATAPPAVEAGQSAQRTASYGKTEWQAIKEESEGIYGAFVALMAEDVPPEDPRAMDVAEQHRAHISRWFYDCPVEIHAGLGQMYIADVRFQKNIDKHGEGLAAYMAAAIAANAAR